MTSSTDPAQQAQADDGGGASPKVEAEEAEKADTPDDAEVDFEASLKALEVLVKQMESGELGLEESLAAFERGVRLTRRCQAALKQAEMRVQALTDEGAFKDLDVGSLDDG